MAKGFSTQEAKKVYKVANNCIFQVKKLEDVRLNYIDRIKAAALAVLDEAILEILSGVPVEEINRGETRLRVSALRNVGITNLAEVRKASAYALSQINGISEESAKQIKAIVDDRYETVKGQTKLKLNADKKTGATTTLIVALSGYRRLLTLYTHYDHIISNYVDQVNFASNDLLPALNGLKFIFASKEKKKTADEAYNYLLMILQGDFGKRCNYIISEMNNVQNMGSNAAWLDFSNNTAEFFGTLEEIEPGLLGNSDTQYGLPEELAHDIQDEKVFSEGLKCHLRNYQLLGVKYILHQEKVLLGDEMGLGKTVQAIAAMVSLKNMGATHFIVVCPAGVISNWVREIGKHSDLRTFKVHGNGRDGALALWKDIGGVAVTTYETTGHIQLAEDFRFSLLVVDEAHYVKNPAAKRTRNVEELTYHADRLLFMTGTAIENNVEEMISLISMLQPDVADEISDIAFMSAAPEFRDRVAPVYYRRKRDDVLTELPELIQIQDWCEMTIQEELIYERNILAKASYPEIRKVSWNVSNLEHSSKAKRLKEIVEEAKLEDRKVIVFSYFLDTIDKVSGLLKDVCLEPITGKVSALRRQEIIDEFDKAPSGSVLVLQIQAGGTGLNIQSASVVVICEPQFKPSIENQAISRAYRMGQSRNVVVHRLLCEDTVDEKIMDLLSNKQEIFNAFADTSVAGNVDLNADLSGEVTESTFGAIVKEEYERISKKHEND